MKVVIDAAKPGKYNFTSTTYDLQQFKSLPLSALDRASKISVIECPNNLAGPVHVIADWFSSHETSFYNWWVGLPTDLNQFRITFSYGSSVKETDLEAILAWDYVDLRYFAAPKQMHFSQYDLLITLIGSTSSRLDGKDPKIEIVPIGISDENYAYLSLGTSKRFVLDPNWEGTHRYFGLGIRP